MAKCMRRKDIPESVLRRLYAESMGKCMNPDCQEDLFIESNDIIEKAHILEYCTTKDNSFDNLIILCPNCHKKYDKCKKIDDKTIRLWKQKRKEEVDSFFSKKFTSFDDLRKRIKPLLMENISIYENYYLSNNKRLWDRFEPIILANNEKIKLFLKNNLSLFQSNKNEEYSNQVIIRQYIAHIDEFKITRSIDEKNRKVLFPVEVNSIFGIIPMNSSIVPMTESLELLLKKYEADKTLDKVILGVDAPYILLNNGEKIYLNDGPYLRQLYYSNNCFTKLHLRLDSLNFVLKYLNSKKIKFDFVSKTNVREICIKEKIKIVFVYVYCINKHDIEEMAPENGLVIVNLHNWNGDLCISQEAYEAAKKYNVTLLDLNGFYDYVRKQ